jgi:hypothetical protein
MLDVFCLGSWTLFIWTRRTRFSTCAQCDASYFVKSVMCCSTKRRYIIGCSFLIILFVTVSWSICTCNFSQLPFRARLKSVQLAGRMPLNATNFDYWTVYFDYLTANFGYWTANFDYLSATANSLLLFSTSMVTELSGYSVHRRVERTFHSNEQSWD